VQCLTTKSGPKTREIFDATLHDDGHRSALPVRASIINDYRPRIGSNDMRQILGTRGLDDQTTFYVTSSRLNAAAQARLGEAAGRRGANCRSRSESSIRPTGPRLRC
jgi:hypothetical protein